MTRRRGRRVEATMKVLAKAAIGAALVFGFPQFVVEKALAGTASSAPDRPKKSLGVSVAPVPPGAKGMLMLDRDRGMVIVDIVPGGAADHAGLRRGDVLLAINGRSINREPDLAAAISAAVETGQTIVEISRQGKLLDVTIAF
jgi:S1-C subfamily serine protease